MGLELYAKIEPLLGFERERFYLYQTFLKEIKKLGAKTLLDVGCGSGDFLKLVKQEGIKAKGIDLSQMMVERAKERGLDVEVRDVCKCKEKFEAVTAIFDVINYLPPSQIEPFFRCVVDVLEPKGSFLCDLNTLYGFSEVALGSLILSEEDYLLALDAEFDGKTLLTTIDFFKKADNCYTREQDRITQYYHPIEIFKKLSLKLVEITPLKLFGEKADKVLLRFIKE